MDSSFYRSYADCFVRYEPRRDEKSDVTYTTAIPLTSLTEIYTKLEGLLDRPITSEDKVNATEIYKRILYGDTYAEDEGIQDENNSIPPDSGGVLFVGGDCISPLGSDWRSIVTSEFGYRHDPMNPSVTKGHAGIDLGVPKGTDIHAARGGRVIYVRYDTTGYGYHLAIDHGDGMVTLYAHCSKILVTAGQTVSQGEAIAQVGSTGKSTGPHLHFEVIVDGTPQNPRSYLP